MPSSKFHLSLNVHDVRQTAGFVELLLGVAPAPLESDYARFELSDPAVVLSLVPTDIPTGGSLNHIGFRLPSRESLSALQQRLSAVGVGHEIEESVACCHSRQSKFWVHDPAGNLWEFYVLEEAAPCAPAAGEVVRLNAVAESSAEIATALWSHRLGEPFPAKIPAERGTLDQVVLEGTCNATQSRVELAAILTEAARALRPGGKLLLHGLTAERPLVQAPRLPGPAAAVEYVPTTVEVLAAIEQAGFVGLELITFGETYCFTHAGAELRETRLAARRSIVGSPAHDCVVIYRGPFAQVYDDAGFEFRRGERTRVDERTFRRLEESSCAAQFIFLARNEQAPGQIGQATPSTGLADANLH